MSDINKERIYLQLYDYETKEFSGLTTYHGLVRIFNSNTWPSRIFWSVVVLSCLSLFMIHSGYLLLGYHAKPTLFQVNTIVPRDGILFPEVTICNMNSISFRKVEQSNMKAAVFFYVLKFLSDTQKSHVGSISLEDERDYEQYAANYFLERGEHFNVLQYLKNVSKQCEETFVSCSFGGVKIDECCRGIVSEMTEIGLCFRLSHDLAEHKQWFSGETYGWELVLNGNNEINKNNIYTPENGFLIMVHERNKFPQIRSHASSVSSNTVLHASITMKNISLLDEQNWGTCSRGWDNAGSSILYTANHCETNCKLEEVRKLCNCTPLVYSVREKNQYEQNICTPMQIMKCFHGNKGLESWNQNCDCSSECDLLDFTVSNSYTRIPNWKTEAENLPVLQTQENVSVVNLFFRQISYERVEQQKQLQTADLLSNIAGSMGLFLGMSTVTLLEIFIYLFKSVWGTVNTARQKQFVEAVAEEERERQQSIVIIQNSESKEEKFGNQATLLRKEELKRSGNSIHIHLDRRNSRMVRGGDLSSASRGSVAIPSQLLSPLSKHSRLPDCSEKNAIERATAINEFHNQKNIPRPNERNPLPIRRSSTFASAPHQKKRDSGASEMECYNSRLNRKISTQSLFKSQLI